jgi:putative transposase
MTRVSIRVTAQTSKQLSTVLARAYQAGDLPLVKRVSALLAIGRGEAVATIAASLGVGPSTIYGWLHGFLVGGVAGLRVQWRGGRPKKLTPTQQQRLAEVIEAGPAAAGFPTGCWHALLIQQVLWREFRVTYNVHYLAALLHTLGLSFQKARFVSDHLDEARRQEWLLTTWPA